MDDAWPHGVPGNALNVYTQYAREMAEMGFQNLAQSYRDDRWRVWDESRDQLIRSQRRQADGSSLRGRKGH
jgi:hypothetical protein